MIIFLEKKVVEDIKEVILVRVALDQILVLEADQIAGINSFTKDLKAKIGKENYQKIKNLSLNKKKDEKK